MASALLHRLRQHYRAAQRRPIAQAAREPAWYIAHRRLLQANLARRDTDPLWFGQALYIQFLGVQIIALAKRLCVLAQVPTVGVYVQSGRLPTNWAQLLKDLGLASLSRATRARLVMPVAQLMPDVQDALAGQHISVRVLHELARRPAAEQRALLRAALMEASTPLSQAIWQQLQPQPAAGPAHALSLARHTLPII